MVRDLVFTRIFISFYLALYWSLHEIGLFKFWFAQLETNLLLIATGAAILIAAIDFSYFAVRLI